MNLKTELANALQLFLLLCLLFWSFTWNSSPSLPFTRRNTPKFKGVRSSNDAQCNKADVSTFEKHRFVLRETFSSLRYVSKRTITSSIGIVPPFKEWKEKEMSKYGSTDSVNHNHPRKLSQRRLNYASSKCGAKILASNPEAKHRIAILSEKADEYMLNPCRVKTWFIIELCDTVEATQIELANNELYSSSPKLFSVFWSEMYPTLVWHLLGTFEGKDQKTMQTFDLNTKNLGKFIKVVIYNHHGNEHYCPLSVIRILGYSMVQEFEDIENAENIPGSIINDHSEAQNKNDIVPEKESQRILQMGKRDEFKNLRRFEKICTLFLFHCNDNVDERSEHICSHKLVCQFLIAVSSELRTFCHLSICPKQFSFPVEISNFNYKEESKNNAFPNAHSIKNGIKSENMSNRILSNSSEFFKSVGDDANKPTVRSEDGDKALISKVNKITDKNFKISNGNSSKDEQFVNKENFIKDTPNGNLPARKNNPELSTAPLQKKCICENNKLEIKSSANGMDTSSDKGSIQDSQGSEGSVDSAGLLQKDSVFIKLTSRIKASELNLDLINKYLQQLSQSYRQQMEDMQTVFNQTVNAINIASEKASVIDYKQQKDINALESRVNSLTRKTEYLMKGQRDMIKNVVELHGFFLILEFIIISTIFTIFLNIFQRRNIRYWITQKRTFGRLVY